MEKFALKGLDKEFLVDLYDLHGYDAMNNRLFQYLKNSKHYKLLSLLEELYPTDKGRGVIIQTSGDWEMSLVDITHEEWDLNFRDMRMSTNYLHLPIWGFGKDRDIVIEFIESIPTSDVLE